MKRQDKSWTKRTVCLAEAAEDVQDVWHLYTQISSLFAIAAQILRYCVFEWIITIRMEIDALNAYNFESGWTTLKILCQNVNHCAKPCARYLNALNILNIISFVKKYCFCVKNNFLKRQSRQWSNFSFIYLIVYVADLNLWQFYFAFKKKIVALLLLNVYIRNNAIWMNLFSIPKFLRAFQAHIRTLLLNHPVIAVVAINKQKIIKNRKRKNQMKNHNGNSWRYLVQNRTIVLTLAKNVMRW